VASRPERSNWTAYLISVSGALLEFVTVAKPFLLDEHAKSIHRSIVGVKAQQCQRHSADNKHKKLTTRKGKEACARSKHLQLTRAVPPITAMRNDAALLFVYSPNHRKGGFQQPADMTQPVRRFNLSAVDLATA